MKKTFEILRIDKNFSTEFKQFCLSFGSEIQILDSSSERPIVLHDEMKQFTFISDGEGFALLDKSLVRLEPGMLLFINKKCQHSFKTEKKLHLIHWHYPREYIEFDRRILSSDIELGGNYE